MKSYLATYIINKLQYIYFSCVPLVNAGMLITYDLPFGQVKKLYGAQQRFSNKNKFKKRHVAYSALHIESVLSVRGCA